MSDARREQVLGVALQTFARFGYRKTSMEDVARAADISRPGLYFLFTSKDNLFRAAVIQALDEDVAAAQEALGDSRRPLGDRLVEAFDRWTGRYIGPMTREVAVLMETYPELLGPAVAEYPRRFASLITEALAAGASPAGVPAARVPAAGVPAAGLAEQTVGSPDAVARTLLSTVLGIKQEVATRDEFVARVTEAVDLFLMALSRGVPLAPTPQEGEPRA